jgi:hypothetical protein
MREDLPARSDPATKPGMSPQRVEGEHSTVAGRCVRRQTRVCRRCPSVCISKHMSLQPPLPPTHTHQLLPSSSPIPIDCGLNPRRSKSRSSAAVAAVSRAFGEAAKLAGISRQ